MNFNEPIQSAASREALNALGRASDETSVARMEVRRLERLLREARKVHKAAEAAETAANRAYEATPYCD